MSLSGSFNRMHGKLRDRQVDDTSGEKPSFTYLGKDRECVANSFVRRTMLEVGGFQVEADLQLFVRKNQFVTIGSQTTNDDDESQDISDTTVYPQAGKLLTFAERTFRIDVVHDPLPHVADGRLQLVCVDPTK